MTEKQEKILTSALKLFAEEGYRSTSTRTVAQRAGVSEGLIFRHFENKEGLLIAILNEGDKQAKLLFSDILMEADPRERIKKFIELSAKIKNNVHKAAFWKLQYKIKWELEQYGANKIEPVLESLSLAFQKLGYPNPRLEAELLVTTLDGMAMRFFLQKEFDVENLMNLMLEKYGV